MYYELIMWDVRETLLLSLMKWMRSVIKSNRNVVFSCCNVKEVLLSCDEMTAQKWKYLLFVCVNIWNLKFEIREKEGAA